MNDTALKIMAGTCIFLGEMLAIYQEMIAARAAKTGGFTWLLGVTMLFWMLVAGALLLAGYYFGYMSLKNIWVVTVLSVGAILIAEPLLIAFFFQESPTIGAWVGLALAVLAIFAALLF